MDKNSKLSIISLNDLLKKNLIIPIYQRPYEWTRANTLTLLDDIYKEYNNDRSINLGTIVLYENDNNELEIVDGQQRIITLSLLYNIMELKSKILESKIQCISDTEKRIISNHSEIKEFINRLKQNSKFEIKNFKQYIQKEINFFAIITRNTEESFQLFDGRNSKFKNLDPVDLLKAYHLGVIKDIEEKRAALNIWNKHINSHFSIEKGKNKIQFLFNDVLFNVYNWSLNKDRRNFSKDDIYLYEGYKNNNKYNYVKYYSAMNNDIYLVNKPFKEGITFFKIVEKFINDYEKIIKNYNLYSKVLIDSNLSSNMYSEESFNYNYYFINIMYYDALFLFINKFGKIQDFEFNTINDYLYKWALYHRINYRQVQYTSINKYIINNNFFYKCNNALDVNELYKLDLCDLDTNIPNVNANSSNLDRSRRKLWEKLK